MGRRARDIRDRLMHERHRQMGGRKASPTVRYGRYTVAPSGLEHKRITGIPSVDYAGTKRVNHLVPPDRIMNTLALRKLLEKIAIRDYVRKAANVLSQAGNTFSNFDAKLDAWSGLIEDRPAFSSLSEEGKSELVMELNKKMKEKGISRDSPEGVHALISATLEEMENFKAKTANLNFPTACVAAHKDLSLVLSNAVVSIRLLQEAIERSDNSQEMLRSALSHREEFVKAFARTMVKLKILSQSS